MCRGGLKVNAQKPENKNRGLDKQVVYALPAGVQLRPTCPPNCSKPQFLAYKMRIIVPGTHVALSIRHHGDSDVSYSTLHLTECAHVCECIRSCFPLHSSCSPSLKWVTYSKNNFPLSYKVSSVKGENIQGKRDFLQRILQRDELKSLGKGVEKEEAVSTRDRMAGAQ